MAATGYKMGRHFKVYVDEDGAGVGTYQRVLIAKDPKLGITWDTGEVSDDASIFKRYLKGLADAPLELVLNRKIGNALYEMFRDAAMDPDAVIGVAICTGLITEVGAELFEADWVVVDFPLEGVQNDTAAITVKLALAANSEFVPTLSEVTAP